MAPCPLAHPDRFRGRLRGLLLLFGFGRGLGRAGILGGSASPLLLPVGLGRLLFLLLLLLRRRFFLLRFRFLLLLGRGGGALGSSSRLLRILVLVRFFGGFALVGGGFGGRLRFGRSRFGLLVGGSIFFFFRAVGVAARGFFLDVELGLVLDDIVAGAGEVDGRVIGLGGFLDGVAAFRLDRNLAFVFLFGHFSGWGRAIPVPGGW